MNEEMKALLKKAQDSIKGARILFDDELFGIDGNFIVLIDDARVYRVQKM
ncbi:MAG TPA: hypothetical protein VKL21_09060 [Candidatus Methanoperedens sp.]|nr:hypothetical protein [Candidatus Methanoperedens sp.]